MSLTPTPTTPGSEGEKKKPIPREGDPRNWPEDFPHDNGNYLNRCRGCGEGFLGHKRRICCKVCANKPDEVDALRAENERLNAKYLEERHYSAELAYRLSENKAGEWKGLRDEIERLKGELLAAEREADAGRECDAKRAHWDLQTVGDKKWFDARQDYRDAWAKLQGLRNVRDAVRGEGK